MIHALKNLSLIGGLFMIAGIGRSARRCRAGYDEVVVLAQDDPPPGRYCDFMRGVEDLDLARLQAVTGENVLR